MRRSTILMLTLTVAASAFGGFHWDRAEKQAAARTSAERELGEAEDALAKAEADIVLAGDVAQVLRHGAQYCQGLRSQRKAILILFKNDKPNQYKGVCETGNDA